MIYVHNARSHVVKSHARVHMCWHLLSASPTHPRHGGRCILCSSDAQASGECQPLLLTFLLLERDRMRRAATGCESPGSLRIYGFGSMSVFFLNRSEAFPRGLLD